MKRPLDGLLFAYVYAAAAALLFVPYASVLIQNDHAMITLAIGAVRNDCRGPLYSTRPRTDSPHSSLLRPAAGISSLQWLDVAEGKPEAATAILALVALAATALATERRFLRNRTGLAIHQSELGPYFFYGAVAIPLGLFLNQEFNDLTGVIAIAVAAVAFAAAYTALHPGAMAAYAATLFVWSALHGIALDENEYWPYVYAGLVAISLAGDRFFAIISRGPTAHVAGPIILITGWLMALRVAVVETPEAWLAHAIVGIAFGYMIYAAGFHTIPGAAVSRPHRDRRIVRNDRLRPRRKLGRHPHVSGVRVLRHLLDRPRTRRRLRRPPPQRKSRRQRSLPRNLHCRRCNARRHCARTYSRNSPTST